MLRIGIAYSLRPDASEGPDDGPDDRFEEFDKPETIEAIASAIRSDGHDVSLLGDGREFLSKMLADPPDFVFNFAEGQGTHRDREARVPAVCEMLGVPYSGSDPLTLAVALDKGVAKALVASCPEFLTPAGLIALPGTSREALIRDIRGRLYACVGEEFPLILKPSYEGSSKGVRGDCLVDSPEEAAVLFARLARDYRQPILIEQFVAGDEVTVGVIGTGPSAEAIGVMRVVPRAATDRFVYSLEVKRDWARRVTYQAPAPYDQSTLDGLCHAAISSYGALGCRDVARIDFRVWEGAYFFIEANPLPGLSPGVSDLVILAEGYGIGYDELIRRILRTALERVGLANPLTRPR